MPQCRLCGHEHEYKARYCAQCGARLSDSGSSEKTTWSEWVTTEELLELSKMLSSTLDLHLLLRKIDDSAVRLTGASAGSTMLFDEGKTSLSFRSPSGEKATNVGSLPVRDGIPWWVAQHGEVVRVNHVQNDARFTGAIDRITGHRTENVLCVPVMLEDETIGVIEVLNKTSETGFTDQDEQLLSILANQAAVAVKNARLATEQRNFFDHVIEILVTAIESTFLVGEGHCWRVAKLAIAVGRELGMQDQELQDLYYAAALHDLGVLKLRKDLADRVDQVKSLPILGANMIRDIGILQGAEPIIRHHHEYLDGSGYPDGLKGEDIPLGSRIIAAVEAYEDAISEGPSQFSPGAYIRENSGKLFDPLVVDALLELMSIDES